MTYSINKKRWFQFSIFEQMGNIGSEVGRSIKAKKSGDKLAFENALKRALDLFEVTAENLTAQKSAKLKEVLRAREQYLELFFGDQPASLKSVKNLENYFMEYAIAARKRPITALKAL